MRRDLPAQRAVEGARGRAGLRERAGRASPPTSASRSTRRCRRWTRLPPPRPREDQPRQGPGVAGQAPDRLPGQDRRPGAPPRRDGAGLGPRRVAAATSTSTPRRSWSTGGQEGRVGLVHGKSAYSGAIEHSGDNLTGAGDGDDETINIDLSRLPDAAYAIVFIVNSFRGQKFTEVRNAYCRLLDAIRRRTGALRPHRVEPHTGVIMCVLIRAGANWDMTAIGEFQDGKSASAMYGPPRRRCAHSPRVDVAAVACHGHGRG